MDGWDDGKTDSMREQTHRSSNSKQRLFYLVIYASGSFWQMNSNHVINILLRLFQNLVSSGKNRTKFYHHFKHKQLNQSHGQNETNW
jgi:hypothetical protein